MIQRLDELCLVGDPRGNVNDSPQAFGVNQISQTSQIQHLNSSIEIASLRSSGREIMTWGILSHRQSPGTFFQ